MKSQSFDIRCDICKENWMRGLRVKTLVDATSLASQSGWATRQESKGIIDICPSCLANDCKAKLRPECRDGNS